MESAKYTRFLLKLLLTQRKVTFTLQTGKHSFRHDEFKMVSSIATFHSKRVSILSWFSIESKIGLKVWDSIESKWIDLKIRTFVKIIQWNVESATFRIDFLSQRHRSAWKRSRHLSGIWFPDGFSAYYSSSPPKGESCWGLWNLSTSTDRKPCVLENQFITQKYRHF